MENLKFSLEKQQCQFTWLKIEGEKKKITRRKICIKIQVPSIMTDDCDFHFMILCLTHHTQESHDLVSQESGYDDIVFLSVMLTCIIKTTPLEL